MHELSHLFNQLEQALHYKEYGGEFFNRFINTKTLDSLFRYKTIMSLKTLFTMRKMETPKKDHEQLDCDLKHFQTSALLSFIRNTENNVNERILGCQYLLTQPCTNEYYNTCIATIIDICEDDTHPYKSRADAVDIVLKYGDKNVGKDLLNKLIILGNNNKTPLNIYQNPQNAHSETIEESANKILETIISIPLIKIENKEIDYEFVRREVSIDKTLMTLERIDLDTALYTKFNTSLKSALVFMYSFICTQEMELGKILTQRLIEELSESSGLCSTGIFERIMNTVSGFVGDLKITISFEEQIHGNLTGRLNARIRNILGGACLHSTIEKFCNCNEHVCVYSYHKKFSEHRLKRIKETACGDCYYCNGEKCSHVCKKETENSSGNSSCAVEFMSLILEEMIIPTIEYEKRRNFLKFFRYVLPYIIEELKEEFKPYIEDATFELYMRRAILAYEGEN